MATKKATSKKAASKKAAKKTASKKAASPSVMQRDDSAREADPATSMSAPARSAKDVRAEVERQVDGGQELAGQSMIDDDHEYATKRV